MFIDKELQITTGEKEGMTYLFSAVLNLRR